MSGLLIDPEAVLLISQRIDSGSGPACTIHLEQSRLLVHGSLEEVCKSLGFDQSKDQMLTERIVIPERRRAPFIF